MELCFLRMCLHRVFVRRLSLKNEEDSTDKRDIEAGCAALTREIAKVLRVSAVHVYVCMRACAC